MITIPARTEDAKHKNVAKCFWLFQRKTKKADLVSLNQREGECLIVEIQLGQDEVPVEVQFDLVIQLDFVTPVVALDLDDVVLRVVVAHEGTDLFGHEVVRNDGGPTVDVLPFPA